jgi:hypothetical protein
MKFPLLPVAATAMLALAACTGGGGDPSGPTPPAAVAPTALAEAARCMRDNGYPDWPNPMRYPDGHWGWPDSAPQVPAPPACEPLMREGKSAQRPSRRPVSAEDMVKLRQWAACVRAHGIPDWPDPDADGLFDPPARLKPIDGNAEFDAATPPCDPLMPAAGVGMTLGNGPSKPPA